jgi:short-subunit dehydrogenase
MKTDRRFEGKVVVVTGASSGIGAAAARAFAAEGGHVVLAARSAPRLERLVSEIAAGGGLALAVPVDVGEPGAPEQLLECAARELGGIDVVVNNAGVNHRGAVEERTGAELAQIVTVNLTAPILLTRAALPYLRRRGAGAIVNVASLAGRVPLPHEATYSATKFGLRAFSFSLAEELAGSGITVAVVSPGPVDTGFIMTDLDHVPDLVFSQPVSTAEQIAALVLDSAADGRRERTASRRSSLETTLGYLFPALRSRLTPLLERRGRAAKETFRERANALPAEAGAGAVDSTSTSFTRRGTPRAPGPTSGGTRA